MRQLRRLGYLGGTALLVIISAQAQYRDDPYYDRGPAYSRAPHPDGGPVSRVLADLDRFGGYDRHTLKEVEQARFDLERFRDNGMRGRFDRDRLDGAIGHLQHVVDSRWISPRERNILARDLDALRDFRANRGYPRPAY